MKALASIFAITLLTFTTGCATVKKPIPQPTPSPEPEIFNVTLTPQELADAFEYRDNKISAQLDQLRKDFEVVTKKIESLRARIAKQVEDCLCPGEMK